VLSNRFGIVPIYNNYYHAPENIYCIRGRLHSGPLIGNNFFEEVNNPWEYYLTLGAPTRQLHRAR
jgi:pectate lyase